jgi:tetratricopeptide (TPR) repeat protein
MAKNDFEFDVDGIQEAGDMYDYSDLDDLSLVPPKKKSTKESEEDELELKAEKGIKILGIITAVIIIIAIIAVGIYYCINLLNNNSYAASYNAGYEAYQAGDYETAIVKFEKALTFEEADNVNERIFLYKCYKTIGDEEKAIQTLLDLLAYDSYNIEAITVVANYYYQTGNTYDLEELIEKYKGTEAESAVSSFMINPPAVSYDSGSYTTSINVVLYSDSGDSIYYTLDGTNPAATDNLYTEPIYIGEGTTTLKAVVIDASGISSEVAEYKYEIEFVTPDAPEIEPSSGTYKDDQQIVITNIPEGMNAYYTLDGSEPDLNSELYTEPIDMPGGNNIFSAVIISADGIASSVVKRNYNLDVSEKYSFNDSVEAIKYVLIKNKQIDSDGLKDSSGNDIKFVYYAKREVDGNTMYLMYYDIMQNNAYERQDYLFGVDVQTGKTYKVYNNNDVLSSEEYK